jgi:hypothetical protein
MTLPQASSGPAKGRSDVGGMGTKHAKPEGAHTRRLGRAHLARPPPQRTADRTRSFTHAARHAGQRKRDGTSTAMSGGGASRGCGTTEGVRRACPASVAAQLGRIDPCTHSAFEASSSGCVRLRGERGRAAESRSRPHDDELRPVLWRPPRHGRCRGRRPQAVLYLRDLRPRAAFAGEALSTGAVYTTQGR